MSALTASRTCEFTPKRKRSKQRSSSPGCTVFTPDFDFDETNVIGNETKKRELTHAFLRKIDSSEAILVVDCNGYVGRSVAIEAGYAYAKSKVIILIEPAEELAVQALTDHVVGIEEILANAGVIRDL